MTQYCPHTTTCPFYQNWEKLSKEGRIDVIFTKGKEENLHYDCIALAILNDSETGISMSNELKNRLSNLEQKFNCSHLTLLNLLTKLGADLEKLLVK